MPIDLILGTAGHIDHGKTALVKALTGVDTDRLPEEKQRGITIDLGFAELPLGAFRLGIVDVPGHERFVRNMLAGATGVDLALLVVAADDSVKPQTREHLEILRLLDLHAGVIALTKCDLSDPEWIELVEQEIRDLVAGTFLAQAPVVRTSVVTGVGLDRLREALARAAQTAVASRHDSAQAPFRMAIDRVFTVAGHGTVVTGSVASGRTQMGDELRIEPGGLAVRVRGLENHGRPAEEVHRGQRAAINLAGVHHEQLRRGQELASPGHLAASRLFSVHLHLLPTVARPLKNRSRVRLHLGTAEWMAAVLLLDGDRVEPGGWTYAQVLLAQPAVAVWGQPFVLRSESPVETIGGGRVLDPQALKLRRRDAEIPARLANLAGADPLRRAAEALYFQGWRPWQPIDLVRTAGLTDAAATVDALLRQATLVEIELSPHRTVRVHAAVFEELAQRILSALDRLHGQHPLQTWLDRARLVSRLTRLVEQPLVEAVLVRLAATGRIRLDPRGIALPGRGPQLSDKQRQILEQIVELHQRAGFQPATVPEIQGQATVHQASVPLLLEVAAADGRLVRITPEFYLHRDAERRLREMICARLADGQGLTVSQIREILDTTRKYAVPICEYLDRIGLTCRRGDVRVLGIAESAKPKAEE
jgi:selenocysteine-specific elongation factor